MSATRFPDSLGSQRPSRSLCLAAVDMALGSAHCSLSALMHLKSRQSCDVCPPAVINHLYAESFRVENLPRKIDDVRMMSKEQHLQAI